MATIQLFTHMYGCRYSRATVCQPSWVLAYQRPRAVMLTPMSDSRIRWASSGRKRVLEGRKWLLPRKVEDSGLCKPPGAAVMLVRR